MSIPNLSKIVIAMGALALVSVGVLLLLVPSETPTQATVSLPPAAPAVEPLPRILFVGDMMFDRYIRERAITVGYGAILKDVQPLLAAHDAVIGNLEGPVVKVPSISAGTRMGDENNMRFGFDERVPLLLKEFGVTAVSIGNNHIRDFGDEGLITTRILLSEAGLKYGGDPDDPSRPIEMMVRGHQVFVIAYNQFGGQTVDDVASAIAALNDTPATVVVFAHWGEEYETAPTPAQRAAARVFIDAGADLVVGAHSHVVGEMEIYKSRRIYYSLGNFVFDQYFSPDTMQGMALSVIIDPESDTLTFAETPVVLRKDGTTGVVED